MPTWPPASAKISRNPASTTHRLEDLEVQLARILGCRVDVVEEPVRKKRFQTEIDRDRTVAF